MREKGEKVSDASANPPVSDTELLVRHLQGDDRAFEGLIKRYQRELFNFLFHMTGNAAMAEDVFQETFLQLHISAGTFDTTRRLKPWLFTIAANKARDALRKKRRRPSVSLDTPISNAATSETSYASLIPSDIPKPEEYLLNTEVRRAVQNIVEDMPDNLRVVLAMSYFEEFSYKQIAETLNIPLGTVKSRIFYAVKSCREILREKGVLQ